MMLMIHQSIRKQNRDLLGKLISLQPPLIISNSLLTGNFTIQTAEGPYLGHPWLLRPVGGTEKKCGDTDQGLGWVRAEPDMSS